MAILSTEERLLLFRGLMRYWSRLRESVNIHKPDLLAAINATDDWIDANAASYNSALPPAVRNNLNTAQKTILFCTVAAMRVSREFARSIIGSMS